MSCTCRKDSKSPVLAPLRKFLFPCFLGALSYFNAGAGVVMGGDLCRDQRPVQVLLQQANDTNRSYDNRRAAYSRAIQLCPSDSALYTGLSGLLLQHEDTSTALAWIHRGLQVIPGDPELTLSLGVALLVAGRPEEALPVLKKLPATAKGDFYLGMAYRALRNYSAAQQAFSNAFAMGYDDPYVLYVLIEQDKALGDKDAGLRHFRTFDEHFPHSPWLHVLLGDAYLSKEDYAQAEAEYRQALELSPNLPIVHFQVGFLAFRRADYATAADNFRKEIALNPTMAESYLYLATTLRRLGRNSEALPLLQQAMNRDPNSAQACHELGTAQIESGQFGPALRTLRAGETRFTTDEDFPVQLARLLRRLGRVNEAKQQAKRASDLVLSRQSRQSNRVQQTLEGEPTLAGPNRGTKEAVTEVPSIRPLSSSQRKNSSNLSRSRGVASAAQTHPSELRNNVDLGLDALRHCLERSDVRCATKALAELRGPIKGSPDYLDLEAQALMLQRRKDDALAAIDSAIQKVPNEYRYLITQGRIYQSFNDEESAIRSFLLADQLRPRSSDTFYLIGMSFFILAEYKRAESHFESALALDTHNHRAAFMLGVTKMISFHLQEAKPYFEEALKLEPNNPFYHLYYGILLSRLGDNASALRQVLVAEQLNPSYALTHYNVGYLYMATGDCDSARRELEEAIRLRPNLPQAYYVLGRVYHRLGMEDKSRQALQEFQSLKVREAQEVQDPVESNLLSPAP